MLKFEGYICIGHWKNIWFGQQAETSGDQKELFCSADDKYVNNSCMERDGNRHRFECYNDIVIKARVALHTALLIWEIFNNDIMWKATKPVEKKNTLKDNSTNVPSVFAIKWVSGAKNIFFVLHRIQRVLGLEWCAANNKCQNFHFWVNYSFNRLNGIYR